MWNEWKRRNVDGYECSIVSFERGSDHGIDCGRISKLEIRKNGVIFAHYDRGWNIRPHNAEVNTICEELLKRYN